MAQLNIDINITTDVRSLVLRMVGNPAATCDALLLLSDALTELARHYDILGTSAFKADSYYALAALVAELAPHRVTWSTATPAAPHVTTED